MSSGACDSEAAHQFALDHLVPLVEHKQKELVRELRVYEVQVWVWAFVHVGVTDLATCVHVFIMTCRSTVRVPWSCRLARLKSSSSLCWELPTCGTCTFLTCRGRSVKWT